MAQGRPHIVDKIKDGGIDFIFNTTEGWQSHRDSASIRASAVTNRIPYFTTAASSAAVVRAIQARRERSLEVRSLQDYYSLPKQHPEPWKLDQAMSLAGRSRRVFDERHK